LVVALKEDASFKKKKKSQMWHLLLWSVLSYKPAMTHFFVLHTAAPLGKTIFHITTTVIIIYLFI